MSDVVNISDEFKNSTKEFVELNNTIKGLEVQLKELRSKKKECSEKMVYFVKNNSLQDTEFKVNNQKIKYAQTRTLQPVNRDYLFQRITEFTMPYFSTIGNDISEKLIDYIMDNRKFVEREYIKSIQIKRVFAARKNL
jgi:hypothetical protein